MENMCKEKVSIIIPTYNRAGTIERAIDSVLGQTYQDFELIIVDDGSTDDTQRIVDSYKDSRVRYLRTDERHGANHARNIGIQNAQGEYIAFQDSDDVWLEVKLEKQMNVFQMHDDVDIVFSRFMRRFLDGSTKLIPNKNLTQDILGKDIAHILSRGNVISTQTMIVRKQCFVQYGLFDVEVPRFQDWEINLRFAEKVRFFCVDEPLVEVFETENSITHSARSGLEGLMLIVKKHEKFFRRYGTLEYYLARLIPMAVEEKRVKELADCLGNELFNESVYANTHRNKNMQSNYAFVKEWISDDSYTEKVNTFFSQYRQADVVIYGFGDIGKLLLKKLTNENKTKIRFLIDQNVLQTSEYEIRRLEDVCKGDVQGVKSIIITAPAHESEIRMNLQNIVSNDIMISLQDIVNREY